MGKKRNLSVFDAIQELESEDVRAESRRRKRTTVDAQRGEAAQSQTKIYNHLVECRILLQRAMNNTVSDDNTESDDETVKDQCDALLDTLLQARHQLTGGGDDDDDDEDKYSDLIKDGSEKLEEVLENEHASASEQWKQVLNQRHKDLKLHAGLTAKSQFRIMDSSFWEQVEATVEYEHMRADEKEEKATFDDSKVYQQVLKDFVANSAAATNATASNRVTAKTKKSQKKDVDRRASKGRKIRYKELPKLVNFTFPLSRPNNSNLDQDGWFKSLFGGAGNRK
jgi:hypothetical protein